MNRKVAIVLIVPLVIAGLFSLFNLLENYETFESQIYDALLQVKPAIPEHEDILLLNIDEDAIVNVGVWPWSRDIVARGLILLREFDVGFASLDIEYVEESPLGVNATMLNEEIPKAFEEEFSFIAQNVEDLFAALAQGQITTQDALEFVEDLTGLTRQSQEYLLQEVRNIARDNDTYFGRTARLNGRAYFTVNMLNEDDPLVPEELKEFARANFTIPEVENRTEGPVYREAQGIRPAILTVSRHAAGAGFPNVIIDPDGVRRRIELIVEEGGEYFPQLAFGPVLDVLGEPKVVAYPRRLVLEDAVFPGETEPTDITIPLTEDQRMLINWPRATFDESFRHFSFYELVLNQELETRLIENLEIMEPAGYLSYYAPPTENDPADILGVYRYAEGVKADILSGDDPERMEEYIQARRYFFEEIGAFLDGGAQTAILTDLEAILSQEELPEDLAAEYRGIQAEIPAIFAATQEVYNALAESRGRLAETIPGAYAFIGFTGTGTTDIGVNPFEEEYMNVGTHAAILNTILQNRFLDKLPLWYSIVLAAVLSILVALIIRNLPPLTTSLVGFAMVLLFLAAASVFFVTTGQFLPMLTPAAAMFFTVIVITTVKFIETARERAHIRNAFSHYLSADVMNEVLSDPSKLALGGLKKHLTAIFTDVKGFSTISEKMEPEDLVKLLNSYLTEMSNIILDQRGTIDKYEGDAIISFFGAPLDFDDHAARACRAAVRMKKMERILNEHFVEEKLSPGPLLTRVGINTGEMVVGNMGTEKKMDYTMMGNSVNLAARLEGVNKQYGTWLLISEATQVEAGEEFAFRKMDRVRVVGINQPVRLFELIDETTDLSPDMQEVLDAFHEGLERFEERDWTAAQKFFEEILKIRPDDGPGSFYQKRCKDFIRKPPPDNWDGAFNLTMK
jgi:adenylate cyclase